MYHAYVEICNGNAKKFVPIWETGTPVQAAGKRMLMLQQCTTYHAVIERDNTEEPFLIGKLLTALPAMSICRRVATFSQCEMMKGRYGCILKILATSSRV